jgi:hypothetical protein
MTEYLKQAVDGLLTAIVWGVAGRLMWVAQEVKAGRRRILSVPLLLWELPVAVAMSQVGAGVAEYLSLSGSVRDGVIVVVAYIGPRMIEHIYESGKNWLRKGASK